MPQTSATKWDRSCSSAFRRRLCLEPLEDRIAPATSAFYDLIPSISLAKQGAVVPVAVNLLNLTDSSSNQGLSSASAVLVYDPTVFSVADADVSPGSLLTNPPPSGTWSFSVTATSTPGEVFINAVSPNAAANVTGTSGGLFANVNFHVAATAPTGTSTIRVATPTNPVPGKSDASNAIAANTSAAYTLNDAEQVNAQVRVTSATLFSVSATPTTLIAGQSVSLTVVALTAGNTTATDYNGTVHFTSSDGQASLPNDTALTNGSGTFTVTLKTAGTQTITATDATADITGTSNDVSVSAAQANHFRIDVPASTPAGTPIDFTVTARDQFNNTDPTYNGTIHLRSTDLQADLPILPSLTAGTGTFSATLKTAGNQTLTATDTATSSITGTSGPVTVSALTATHLGLVLPAGAILGVPFNFTLNALDQFNNVAPTYSATVQFGSSDGAATLPGATLVTGGTATLSATFNTLATQSLNAADNSPTPLTVTSSAIPVSFAPTHFVINAPSTIAEKASFTITITALDANNNVATGYTGTVHFTSSDGQALLPANTTLTKGVGTFTVGFNTAGTQTITATDTATPSLTGSSDPITVNAAVRFTISAPTTATAGTAFTITITALDVFGNIATDYSGGVHFTSSDGSAVLPPDAALFNGTRTFTITLKTAGSHTLTVNDSATPSITGSSSAIAVSPAAASRFALSVPTTTTAGTPFTVTVTAQDALGNTVTDYAGTVHFSTNDLQAVLPADTTLTNGTGIFTVTLKTAGSQLLSVSDTTTVSIAGNVFITVNATAAMGLSVGTPAAGTAGTPFTITVTAFDAFGNTATSYNGTVHFSSSDNAAVLPADAALANGNGTFTVTFKTPGTHTLTATDVATPSLTGSSPAIVISAGAATLFIVSAPTATTAGTGITATVVAFDAVGNIATGYTGTVHFSSSDAAATLPADATLTNGVGSFTVTLKTAGSQTLTVSDSKTPSVTGNSAAIAVGVATLSRLTLSVPATTTAGATFRITVTAQDAFGNTVPSYAGTVHLSSGDSAAALPPDATLVNGVGTFTVTLNTAGKQTLTATDTATASLTGTSSTAVSAAATTHFSLSAPATATAGTVFSVTVTALDAFGNTATSYAGTVHFTSSDGSAVLPADATLTNGVGTFSVTLNTAGTVSLTVPDTGNAAVTGNASVSVSAATLPAQRAVLTQLYQGLLGRTLDPAGETVWMNAFSQGASQEDVANAIMASAEYRTKVVQDLYQAILGRTADADGLNNWVAFLGTGGSLLQLKANLLGSPEYANLTGGSDQGFLAGVYGYLFGRGVDPSGAVGWGAALADGTSRAAVALSLATSLEGRQALVKQWSQTYLHRAADPAGLDYFGALLQAGLNPHAVLANLLGSAEYASLQGSESQPPAVFFDRAYRQLLGRPLDQAGLTFWTSVFDQDNSGDTVLAGIRASVEYRTIVVENIYARLLQRTADPTGLENWVAFLGSGGTEAQIEQFIRASSEFQTRFGG